MSVVRFHPSLRTCSSVGRAIVKTNTSTAKIKEQSSNLKAERSKFIFFKVERANVKDKSFTKSLENVYSG
jgi:hypothetical protein